MREVAVAQKKEWDTASTATPYNRQQSTLFTAHECCYRHTECHYRALLHVYGRNLLHCVKTLDSMPRCPAACVHGRPVCGPLWQQCCMSQQDKGKLDEGNFKTLTRVQYIIGAAGIVPTACAHGPAGRLGPLNIAGFQPPPQSQRGVATRVAIDNQKINCRYNSQATRSSSLTNPRCLRLRKVTQAGRGSQHRPSPQGPKCFDQRLAGICTCAAGSLPCANLVAASYAGPLAALRLPQEGAEAGVVVKAGGQYTGWPWLVVLWARCVLGGEDHDCEGLDVAWIWPDACTRRNIAHVCAVPTGSSLSTSATV